MPNQKIFFIILFVFFLPTHMRNIRINIKYFMFLMYLATFALSISVHPDLPDEQTRRLVLLKSVLLLHHMWLSRPSPKEKFRKGSGMTSCCSDAARVCGQSAELTWVSRATDACSKHAWCSDSCFSEWSSDTVCFSSTTSDRLWSRDSWSYEDPSQRNEQTDRRINKFKKSMFALLLPALIAPPVVGLCWSQRSLASPWPADVLSASSSSLTDNDGYYYLAPVNKQRILLAIL